MKRILFGIFMVIASAAVTAQQPQNMDQMKPYIQVKTVAGDEFVVRTFFSPMCTYSKQYYGFFRNLSHSLPDGQRFEFTPVVNKSDGIEYALAFMAVRRYYPAYVANFVEASLIGTQDLGMAPKNWAAIEKIAKAAQLPVSLPQLVAEHLAILKADVDKTIRMQHDLKITNTPSVAVAGTYVVTPEFTAGDTEQFSRLVNGIISMVSVRH